MTSPKIRTPIYDMTLNQTLFQTYVIISSLVQTNVKLP